MHTYFPASVEHVKLNRGSVGGGAWFKVVTWRVTKEGWLRSSGQQPASPQSEWLGPGGVALRAPTPATRSSYPLGNHAVAG